MKRTALLAALMLMALPSSTWGAATVLLNNYDSNVPALYQHFTYPWSWDASLVPAPLNQNFYVVLLGGPTCALLQPVTIAGTTTFIIPIADVPGFFDAGVGVVPGVVDRATACFQLWLCQARQGQVDFGVDRINQTARWSQATGAWDPAAQPPLPPAGPPLQLPIPTWVVDIPEPSTLALGLLGAAALFLRRRH